MPRNRRRKSSSVRLRPWLLLVFIEAGGVHGVRARTCTPRLGVRSIGLLRRPSDVRRSMSTRRNRQSQLLLLSFLNAASNSAVPSTPCQAEEAPKPSISCWTLEKLDAGDEEGQATVVVPPLRSCRQSWGPYRLSHWCAHGDMPPVAVPLLSPPVAPTLVVPPAADCRLLRALRLLRAGRPLRRSACCGRSAVAVRAARCERAASCRACRLLRVCRLLRALHLLRSCRLQRSCRLLRCPPALVPRLYPGSCRRCCCASYHRGTPPTCAAPPPAREPPAVLGAHRHPRNLQHFDRRPVQGWTGAIPATAANEAKTNSQGD